MSDEDRWQRSEQPRRGRSTPSAGRPPTSAGRPSRPSPHGPSTPPTLRFDPLASAIGVFFAIAVPIVVVGYTRSGGTNKAIVAIGIVVGLVAGLLTGIWLAHRDGRVWRGPQL
ncbi:MAG: hypothetical protein ACR2MK_01725 [Solirubrobacteraceae bacterium]